LAVRQGRADPVGDHLVATIPTHDGVPVPESAEVGTKYSRVQEAVLGVDVQGAIMRWRPSQGHPIRHPLAKSGTVEANPGAGTLDYVCAFVDTPLLTASCRYCRV
jgi:hypothetical protein